MSFEYKDCIECVHFIRIPCGRYCNINSKRMKEPVNTEEKANSCDDYDYGDIHFYGDNE